MVHSLAHFNKTFVLFLICSLQIITKTASVNMFYHTVVVVLIIVKLESQIHC